MEDLLPYFERELVLLRRYGAEFAARFPRVAGRLGAAGDDPQTERLLQGVALLSARVAKRLDDGYPQFTEALLESLFPHYLRPFPACAIAAFAVPAAQAGVTAIARGSALESLNAVDGVHCRFSTAAAVTLAPLAIETATFDPLIRAPHGTPLPADAAASLSITIAALPDGPALTALPVDTLRLYIDGDPSFCAALRDTLFLHAGAAYVEGPQGRWLPLPGVPMRACGFDEDDALVPYGERSHPMWRVLTEYFCFPEKFRFVELDMAMLRARMPAGARSVTIHLALSRVRPDAPAARMLRTLNAASLRLFCAPVVNLFTHHARPIAVTHAAADYAVVPDVKRPETCEVYAVDAVRKLASDGSGVVEFAPLHGLRGGAADGRWTLRHDDTVAVISPGYEKRLALTGAAVEEDERCTVSVDVTCTNRDLAQHLPIGGAAGDLALLRGSDGPPARLLSAPTRPFRCAAAQTHLRLVSYLTLNHHALVPDGLPALQDLLRLHDLPESPITQRLIGGIVGLDHVQKTAWMPHEHGASLVYGLEVRVTVEEEAFAGSGIALFAQVLDRFLALYVQVNHFTELVLLAQRDNRELVRCKRRSGNASPA